MVFFISESNIIKKCSLILHSAVQCDRGTFLALTCPLSYVSINYINRQRVNLKNASVTFLSSVVPNNRRSRVSKSWISSLKVKISSFKVEILSFKVEISSFKVVDLEFKSRDLEFNSRDLEFKDYYGMALIELRTLMGTTLYDFGNVSILNYVLERIAMYN